MAERSIAEQLRELAPIVGYYATNDPDPRIDLPLAKQVQLLIDWACSQVPERFTRTIPVQATDHDELITWTLGKLVRLGLAGADRIDTLEAEAAAVAPIIAWADRYCPWSPTCGQQQRMCLSIEEGVNERPYCPRPDLNALAALGVVGDD